MTAWFPIFVVLAAAPPQPSDELAPPDEQPQAKAEREKMLQAVQEKLKPFNDKAQKLYPAMFKGQPQWHGHVWLYRRKAAKAE